MTRQTHTIDGVVYCGDLTIALPTITLTNATLGACAVAPPPPPPPGTIPPGRQTFGRVSWGISAQDSRNADYRAWEQIWGSASGHSAPVAFPGPSVTQAVAYLSAGSYIAAQFVATGNPKAWGMFIRGNNPFGPPIDLCISAQPGDFSVDLANPGALKLNSPSDLSTAMIWTVDPANVNRSYAHLVRGQTYYLNVRFHDAHPTGSSYPVYLQHSHT